MRCTKTRHAREDLIHTNSAGLCLMASGPYLAWSSLILLERLPEQFFLLLAVTLGRFS